MRTAPLPRAWPILLVAVALWFWPVPWSLWTDEFFSAGFAGQPLGDVIAGVSKDRHPPLYFVLLSLLGRLTDADNGLRALSGLAMLGALAVTVDAARRHLSERASLVVGAWFAASAVPALFAHTLRMYALACLAGAVMTWGALEVLAADDARARRGRYALAIGGIAAFWTHYAATLVGVAAFAVAFAGTVLPGAQAPRARRLGPLVGAAGAVVIGCLPWLLGPFREQLAERDPVGAMVWEVWAYLFWAPSEHLPPLAFVAFGCAAAGAVVLGRRGGPQARFAVGFAAAMVLLPLVASANVPARLVRNYIGFFPAAALFAGAAIDALVARLKRPEGGAEDWIGAAVAAALTAPITLGMLAEPVHPQDINVGHDYRIEAQVLDAVIPADAAIRFQPTYVVHQFSRYAPKLKERADRGNPTWELLTSGTRKGGCMVLYAFRVRVVPPEGTCEALLASLSTAADRTGYPGLLLERAFHRMNEGDLPGTQADLDRVLARPQRWPAAWMLQGQVFDTQGDKAAALSAYEEALRVARAYEPKGKVTAGIWRKVGRLKEKAGDAAGAAAATEAATCADSREPAWACGGLLAWATRPAEVLAAEDDDKPDGAAKAASAPEGAKPARGGGKGRGGGGVTAPVAAASATFAGAVPEGWSVEGVVTPSADAVVIGDGAGTVSAVCSPAWTVSGAVSGSVTRSAELPVGDPPSWTRIEARALDASGRALPGVKPANLVFKKGSQPLEAVPYSWTPPAEAGAWRLCVRTGGGANGTTTLQAVTVGG